MKKRISWILALAMLLSLFTVPMVANAEFVDYSEWFLKIDEDFGSGYTLGSGGVYVQKAYSAFWSTADEMISGVPQNDSAGAIGVSSSSENFVVEFDMRLNQYRDGYSNIEQWWNIDKDNATNHIRALLDNGSIVMEKTWGAYNYQTLSTSTGLITEAGVWHTYRIALIGATTTIQEKIGGVWTDVGSYTNPNYSSTEAANGRTIEFSTGKAFMSFDNIKMYMEEVPDTFPVDYSDWYAEVDADFAEASDKAMVSPQYPANWTVTNGVLKAISTDSAGNIDIGVSDSDYVLEFDIRVDSFVASAGSNTNPKFFWYFRYSNPANVNTNRFLIQAANICYENGSYASNNFQVLSTELSLGDIDVWHTYRIAVIGDTYTIQQKIGNYWIDVATYTDNDYSSTTETPGDFRIGSSGGALFSLDNIKIYVEEAPQYTYTFYDEDGTTVLKTATVDIGSEIVPPANPTKASDGTYSYTFAGWTGFTAGMTMAEADISFTATYTQAPMLSFPDYSEWYCETNEDFSSFSLSEPGNIYVQKPYGAYWQFGEGYAQSVEVTDSGLNGAFGITSTSKDVIIELDAMVDSFYDGAATPQIWVNIDKADATNHIRGLIDDKFYVEKAWGSYQYQTLSTTVGLMNTADVWHTYRFALIGGTITVQEKIGDVWTDIGTYTNTNYNAEAANGRTFEFSTGKAYMAYDNIKVYVEETPVPEFVFASAFDGLSMVPSMVNIPLSFETAVTQEALAANLTVKESGVAVNDYTLTVAEDGLSATISFADGLKHTSTYEVVIGTGLTGGEEASISFTTGYALAKANLEDDANNWNFKDTTFAIADGKLTATTQGGTWAEIKDVNVENFGLSFTETRVGDPPSTAADDRLWYNLKYYVENEKENYVQLRFNKSIITTYPFVNGAWGDGKNLTGYTPLSQDVAQDIYFAGNGNNLSIFVKYNGDDNYTYIGTLDNFAGNAGTIRFVPVRNVEYDNVNLYLPAALTAELAESPAPVAQGTELVFNFSGEIASSPATVTITDEDGATYTATVNAKENKKQLGVVLPQALNYSYTYTVDFTGVRDINGGAGQATEFVTWDKAPEYTFSNPVYYKVTGTEEAPVETEITSLSAGKIKVTRDVTKVAAEALGTVVMVTAVYREEGALDEMVVCKTTTSSELVLDQAAEISTVVDVPSDGGSYYIRTFVWQNLTTCNPLAQMKEFK